MPIPDCVAPSNLSGELLEGLPLNDSSILSALGSRTSKPYCAVYSWIVLDVAAAKCGLESESSATFQESADVDPSDSRPARLPLVLFSHDVGFDSFGRVDKGASVRSSYAISYDGRGIFETEDTIYVLFGNGFRRPAALEAINAIPEGIIDESWTVDSHDQGTGIAALSRSSSVVHCDIQMSVAQGHALVALVQALRDSGHHAILESVFRDIEREVGTSVGIRRERN
ncbi:hypothetical protein ALP50_01099 [Pseudomonas syringae pv. spinaceae]|uniref:DUF6957 domain-containing protein n=1 Tax=Pseudomonas syringae pv. spinaceae TaxID=264459 RepID=A0A0Q0ECU3_PSESX|nr:hypothetical protein [Pseudomonas syringae]KPZ09222.1 Uncharacterized protein ALO94_03122 [Pseudomonas syringae pv. spinaceae]RMT31367.1 hypothetical protein ALP50_01099 [Pseudomonas syringae pv. spinaceae]